MDSAVNPPLPSSVPFAALTIAFTSSVVMSATQISSCVAPTSAVGSAAFEAHPPYETLLQTIPTVLVTWKEPGLIGCAALAQNIVAAPA